VQAGCPFDATPSGRALAEREGVNVDRARTVAIIKDIRDAVLADREAGIVRTADPRRLRGRPARLRGARDAANPDVFYRLPPEQAVEIGLRVDL
jgi:hypothetical protein